MKKYFILLFIFNSFILLSQTTDDDIIKFNKTYTEFGVPVSKNIIAEDDKYIMVGGELSSIYSILVVKTDNYGNVLDEKNYTDSLYYTFHGEANSLHKLSETGYILVVRS